MNEKIMKERNEGIRIREGFSEALKQEQCRNKDPRTIALDLQYLLLQNEKKKIPSSQLANVTVTIDCFLPGQPLIGLSQRKEILFSPPFFI